RGWSKRATITPTRPRDESGSTLTAANCPDDVPAIAPLRNLCNAFCSGRRCTCVPPPGNELLCDRSRSCRAGDGARSDIPRHHEPACRRNQHGENVLTRDATDAQQIPKSQPHPVETERTRRPGEPPHEYSRSPGDPFGLVNLGKKHLFGLLI